MLMINYYSKSINHRRIIVQRNAFSIIITRIITGAICITTKIFDVNRIIIDELSSYPIKNVEQKLHVMYLKSTPRLLHMV